jgi:hypothetical protein
MEGMIEIVNGKPRHVITRKNKQYIRVAIEFEVNDYSKFEKKVQMFGKNVTDGLRELMSGFNNNFGINDDRVKDPGSLFDSRMSRHVETAVRRAFEEIARCQIPSQN